MNQKLLILLLAVTGTLNISAQEFPTQSWKVNLHPERTGWDTAKLGQVNRFIIDSSCITGMMIVHRGQVVFQYGDVAENSYIASCRKSVLSILYGPYVLSGQIKLSTSLKDMQLDDVGGLLPIEKEATINNILQARSGVFHPASYPGDYLELAPPRGSVKPGAYWLYSNWDFNIAGYIFEKQTSRNIYDEVQRQLAIPLQMQDWNRKLQVKEGDSSRSFYPAYPMWFSTRDMARIGYLMLRGGKWLNKQVIDPRWMKQMLEPVASYTEVENNTHAFAGTIANFGYAQYWWLWQNTTDYRLQNAYAALGAMGQAIAVFPNIDAVVVFKTKETYQRETPYAARFRLLQLSVQCFKL